MHARRNVSHRRVFHAGDLPAAARALVQGLAAFQRVERDTTALTMFLLKQVSTNHNPNTEFFFISKVRKRPIPKFLGLVA